MAFRSFVPDKNGEQGINDFPSKDFFADISMKASSFKSQEVNNTTLLQKPPESPKRLINSINLECNEPMSISFQSSDNLKEQVPNVCSKYSNNEMPTMREDINKISKRKWSCSGDVAAPELSQPHLLTTP